MCTTMHTTGRQSVFHSNTLVQAASAYFGNGHIALKFGIWVSKSMNLVKGFEYTILLGPILSTGTEAVIVADICLWQT